MNRSSARALAILVLVATFSVVTAGSAAATFAGTNWGTGTIRVTVQSPVDGTALLEVHRLDAPAPVRTVTVKDTTGGVVDIVVPSLGTYRIAPRAMTVGEVRYVGGYESLIAWVSPGSTVQKKVNYVKSRGVQKLRVSGLSETAVELGWEVGSGQVIIARRRVGDEAAKTPFEGTRVPVSGTTLTDNGLQPGTSYTYTLFSYPLFAVPGDGSFGSFSGDPVSISVSSPTTETGAASFVLNPRARILSADDIATEATTGNGVLLTLAAGETTPVPGDILSLPVSTVLAGGYLGEVVSVSQDGRTIELIAGSMAAAFDLYSLNVPDFNATPTATRTAAQLASASPTLTNQAEAQLSREEGSSRISTSLAKSSAAALTDCGVNSEVQIDDEYEQAHEGHADITISKYEIKWFPDIENGVGFDLGYSTSMTWTLEMESALGIECGLDLDPYVKQLSMYPVPVAFEVHPEVNLTLSTAGSIENLGFNATAGFSARGYMGLEGDDFFDGDTTHSIGPTEPTAKGTFSLGAEIGGALTFGPGVGTSDAGVIVGIGGEFFPVDASASVVNIDEGADDGTLQGCIDLAIGGRIGVNLALRAWLPGFEVDHTIPIDALSTSWDYLGSPWHFPEDCLELPPSDDVVGDGAEVVDDEFVGIPDQWGKVEGFIPGQSSWVLSTGRVADSVGSPSFFASTDLGLPGSSVLTELSGHPTYDATAFAVTVIPEGETLNVRYAFASEEYLEYVDSQYNDVMAVLINGKNCALVPGTETPVSINSINHLRNTEHFVDTTSGAVGYGTTMDGITTPLTCSVPVTPGTPVTVRITVADASDGDLDSAIALLDGGIWSE
jgi:hypothetical protein